MNINTTSSLRPQRPSPTPAPTPAPVDAEKKDETK